jgi:hypothetical protein
MLRSLKLGLQNGGRCRQVVAIRRWLLTQVVALYLQFTTQLKCICKIQLLDDRTNVTKNYFFSYVHSLETYGQLYLIYISVIGIQAILFLMLIISLRVTVLERRWLWIVETVNLS